MKIFILKVDKQLHPLTQPFRYPSHNRDFGVEQDFLIWLQNNPQFITSDSNEADWHYLPVFWTRWHLNHGFGKDESGILKLNTLLDGVILNDAKTFTICQNDDGPIVDLGKTVQFLASRKSDYGIDIPLLCDPHKKPILLGKKKYLTAFNGNFTTHPLREEIKDFYKGNTEVYLENPEPRRWIQRLIFGKPFIENMLRSYTVLSPRGYGGSSFRFFEAMQLGVAPFMVSDIDTRPFKKFIDWDGVSYFASSVEEMNLIILNFDKDEALIKGEKAKQLYFDKLDYQKWCSFVLEELKIIT